MEYAVDSFRNVLHQVIIGDAPVDDGDVWVVCEIFDVVCSSGGEVVDDGDFVVGFEIVSKVRANESGTAGDEVAHIYSVDRR